MSTPAAAVNAKATNEITAARARGSQADRGGNRLGLVARRDQCSHGGHLAPSYRWWEVVRRVYLTRQGDDQSLQALLRGRLLDRRRIAIKDAQQRDHIGEEAHLSENLARLPPPMLVAWPLARIHAHQIQVMEEGGVGDPLKRGTTQPHLLSNVSGNTRRPLAVPKPTRIGRFGNRDQYLDRVHVGTAHID